MSLTAETLAKLADHEKIRVTPWAVYADGLGEVYLCPQDHSPLEPCTHRFDRAGAWAFADQLIANCAAARAMHGVEAIPEITPYVLCYGVPWTQR